MAAPLMTPAAAQAARAAALAVPGVAGLSRGRFGEVCLLFPGARVEGLRPCHRDGRSGLEAHIVVDVAAGRRIHDVAEEVRAAVVAAADVDIVDVIVADAE
ncbi:hypothetical protein [Corynebacterium auris]|uniref:hypothetical protein n=1 Tax=Corynebacterium auris TaxID=44750 RepID=UPI0025B4FD82|nr:hypothetical protein [Corynebacterium auris]